MRELKGWRSEPKERTDLTPGPSGPGADLPLPARGLVFSCGRIVSRTGRKENVVIHFDDANLARALIPLAHE